MSVNGNDVNKLSQAKTPSRFKVFKSFEWDDYLKSCGGDPAPKECFNHPAEPPANEFAINQKLEVNSPHNFDFVHLATVVSFIGPRLQLRLDGCDNSNDIFELVDSSTINPIGTRQQRNKYFAAPLRFRKDAASYASFCQSALKNAVAAPKSAFKAPPKEPTKNLFKQGMKLEAVDLKHPSSICPATIADVDKDSVMIHLDGWDDSNDYKCSFKARTLFPVGWCKMTGYPLQYPGPKVDLNKYCEKEVIDQSTTAEAVVNSLKASHEPRENKSTAPGQVVNHKTSETVKSELKSPPQNTNIQSKTEIKPSSKLATTLEYKQSPTHTPHLSSIGSSPKMSPATTGVSNSSSNKIHIISQSNSASTATTTTTNNNHTFTISHVSKTLPNVLVKSTATATIAPKPTITKNFISKSTNQNIHLTPKSNSIGDQIKQQQQQQMQVQVHNQKVNSHMAGHGFVHLNSNNSSERGIKRPSQPYDAEKKRNIMLQANSGNAGTGIGSRAVSSSSTPNSTQVNPRPVGAPIIVLSPQMKPAFTATQPAFNTTITTTSGNRAPAVNGMKKKPSAISKYSAAFPSPNEVKNWSTEEVIEFLNLRLPEFNKHESLFRSHEIDGNAFLLLTNESIIKFLNIKLGYSLKICNIVDRINETDS